VQDNVPVGHRNAQRLIEYDAVIAAMVPPTDKLGRLRGAVKGGAHMIAIRPVRSSKRSTAASIFYRHASTYKLDNAA
jgi:hypothetical protein